MRQAYVAIYPTPDEEVILARDSFWSPELSKSFDNIAMIYTGVLVQGWYSDDHQVTCMAIRGV